MYKWLQFRASVDLHLKSGHTFFDNLKFSTKLKLIKKNSLYSQNSMQRAKILLKLINYSKQNKRKIPI